jgi:predicted nucleic acid-binding protein
MGAGSTFSQGANANTANPYGGTTSPYFGAAQAQSLGNLAGAQQASQANKVNQVTPYGSLNYSQQTDAYGNPSWTATQSLSPELQSLTQSSLQGLQASQANPMYGINPGQTYSDAIMKRLQPQIAQSDEQQTAALANQGIVPGTQAYDNAMRTYNQQKNDLLTSAQINGMQTGLQAQQLQGTQAGQIKNLATPNLINAPQQAAVAGPDYMGALATQTNANIAAQNAQLGQQTANTAGLYGLGSAGILGLAANPGLIGSAATGIGNAYNYLTSPSTSAGYMNSIGATSSGAYDPAMSSSSYLNNLYGTSIF